MDIRSFPVSAYDIQCCSEHRNTCILVDTCKHFPRWLPGRGMLNDALWTSATFLVLAKLLSQTVNPDFIPSAAFDSTHLCTSYPNTWNTNLLIFADPVGGKWYLIVLSQCISLMTFDIEHFLMFLGHLSSFCYCLYISTAHIFLLFLFLLMDGLCWLMK